MFEMARGLVPVMTKGSFATYFGGAEVVKQIETQNGGNIQPSLVFPAFFVVSSVFQIVLYLYKKVRSSQKPNIPSYLQALRRNLGKLINFPMETRITIRLFSSGECVKPLRGSGPPRHLQPDVLHCAAAPEGHHGGSLPHISTISTH